jgi:hypothetical protein
MDGEKNVIFNTIGSPIEQRGSDGGNPNAILHCGSPLNRRQRVLLAMLPEYDSRAVVRKDRVSMKDLSALTAATGDEFALFTRGPKRLVIRGDYRHVNIDRNDAAELRAQGYRWSGHTHVKLLDGLEFFASDGDYDALYAFDQKASAIYNSKGESRTLRNKWRGF